MKKLADIFYEFEKTYQEKLNKIIEQINDFVDEKIETVIDRIKICMKDSNKLEEKDRTEFQKAFEFERNIAPLISTINSSSFYKTDKPKI